jgi:hypothetical protein
MASLAGTYSQGTRTVTVMVRDGKLFLQQGGRETPIDRIQDHEIAAGAARFIIVNGPGGKPEYLHAGGRSWRKVS